MRQTVFSKNYQYLVNGGQWSISTINYYQRFVEFLPEKDAEIDAYLQNNQNIPDWISTSHYYPIEWWQQFDIDDIEDFRMMETLFREYILKPLGKNCYKRYKTEKEKMKE